MILANMGYPPDIRVDKEARVLAEGGHEIVLLCRRESGQPERQGYADLRVVRHRVHPGNSVRRKIDSLRYLLTLDSPSWRKAMERLVTEDGVQALHCHDLAYAKSALAAGANTGVPVVLDFHENYPAALRLWRRRWLDRTLFTPERAEKLERWAVERAARIVVVVDEAGARLIADGADSGRITVFGNTESVELVPEYAEPLPEGIRMVYVGGIAPHRGLESTVEAMPAIRQQSPDAHLTIVGDGVSFDELKELAESLGVNDCVTFTGRLPLDEAMEEVRQASIGLVPHLKSPHTEATVPHKLFQYMALGRPVLVSDCAPLKRIVEETDSGGVFEAGDANSFAKQALALGADSETLAAAGAAGRAAALGEWNLEHEADALVGMYDELAAEDRRA